MYTVSINETVITKNTYVLSKYSIKLSINIIISTTFLYIYTTLIHFNLYFVPNTIGYGHKPYYLRHLSFTFNIFVNHNTIVQYITVRHKLTIHCSVTPFIIRLPIHRPHLLERVYKPMRTPHWHEETCRAQYLENLT